jgi:hypothetical protein
MKYGIEVYNQDGKNNRTETFSTKRPHMLLDLDYVPKRFDLLLMAPNNLTSPGSGVAAEELLVSIKHGLLYVPKAIVFFYVKTAEITGGGLGRQPVNAYQKDYYFYGTAPNPIDALYYTIDDTYLKVFHRYSEIGASSTSSSNLRTFYLKYLITSRKGAIVTRPANIP